MKTINTLVLSGGGIKGISYTGVLKYLEKIKTNEIHDIKVKIDIKTLCCVSVGSIIGLLYILKYTSKEIENEILQKNFKTLKDFDYTTMFDDFGIDTGVNIMAWIESQLLKKSLNMDITFRELYIWNNIDFQVIVTNLSKQEMEIHNHLNTPNMKVLLSIRMSISIPFFYESIKYNNCIYTDGGVTNNYPIRIFSNLDNVIGCNLISSENQEKTEINSFDSYIFSLLKCIKNNILNLTNEETQHTIFINTNGYSTLNFLLTKKEKKALILLGYSCTEKYFEKFNCNV